MNDGETLWLNVTNIALGAAVAACLLYLVFCVAYHVAVRTKKRWKMWAELEREILEFSKQADEEIPWP